LKYSKTNISLFVLDKHQVLPCQTVVRPARVGASPALLRDKPWPTRESRISTVDTTNAGLQRFRLVVYDGDTVHARKATVMPRNRPGLFRSTLAGERRFNKDVSQSNVVLAGVVKVWSWWALVLTP